MLIAQLSDPHLCPAGVAYQSVLDTTPAFAQALARALEFAPDLLLITGDLTETGTPEEYAVARKLLADLPVPVLILPGNHDSRDVFRQALQGLPGLVPIAATGPLHAVAEGALRVVGLDVTVPGDHHGQIGDAHLDWLDRALASAPDTPTLLAMHQPPFRTGMEYIDAYRCFGEDRLADLLQRHPQVVAVVAGHVHRFVLTRFAGRPAMTAPAVATSLALRLAPGAEPGSIAEPPGLLLHLWRDGQLVTHLQPTESYSGPYPFF